MIKSNTKAAQRRIIAHVLSWFVDAETKAEKLEALREQVRSLIKNGPAAYCPTYYAAGLKMAEGGCGACYIGDARRELAEWLESTPEESAKHDDTRTWSTYCHLCAREIAAIMEGRRESVLNELD